MRQYLNLAQDILDHGRTTHTRTGIDTIGIYGAMMQFNLADGFPILTTKRVLFSTVVDELLWFIRGGHNVRDADAPKKIWDDWADEMGNLGRIYGVQWRDWQGYELLEDGVIGHPRELKALYSHDQLTLAIERVKHQPNNRQNIVSAWNTAEIEQGLVGFKPCHVLFQLRRYDDVLDMCMYQRSADMCLGVPFNISSYALLLTLIANECGLTPGVLTHFLADAHVYMNHVETLKEQLQRKPLSLPYLMLMNEKSGPLQPGFKVTDITKEHIYLGHYAPHRFLKYEVAV